MAKILYHATKSFLKPGDTIIPGFNPNFTDDEYVSPDFVYLTATPIPHHTIAELALREDWNVYEVLVKGAVSIGLWDDYMTKGKVTVVKRVGSAGIAIPGNLTKKQKRVLKQLKDKAPILDVEEDDLDDDEDYILNFDDITEEDMEEDNNSSFGNVGVAVVNGITLRCGKAFSRKRNFTEEIGWGEHAKFPNNKKGRMKVR